MCPPPHTHTHRPAQATTGPGGLSSKVRGQVPLRVWLIVAYLSLLHIVVMVSFTHRSDITKLCASEKAGAAAAKNALLHDKVLP